MVKEVCMEKMLSDATENFTTGFMCSESVLEVLNRHYELGIGEEAIALSTGFPYGFGDGGNVCGAVAGATMCLGKGILLKERSLLRLCRVHSAC